jgi:hypothetical protein
MGIAQIERKETMIGYLKVVGVVVAVGLAMGAIAAPVAQAQEQGLLTSPGPVTLTAVETGESGSSALTAFGVSIDCPGCTYSGHKYNVTPRALLLSGAVRVTLTPHYKQENCTTIGAFRTTIHTNGCDYVLHIEATDPAENNEGTYSVKTDIVCPQEKGIEITVYTTEPKHDNDEPFCVVTLKGQAGLAGAHVVDTGNGYIDIEGTFEGVHIERKTFADPVLCPTQTNSTAKLDVDLTVEAHNAAGEPKSISISE